MSYDDPRNYEPVAQVLGMTTDDLYEEDEG